MNVTFFSPKKDKIALGQNTWSNQDIADFYRAVDILSKAGLEVEVESGCTDEGDPWFVFVRSETSEVIAHFAQIDGTCIAVSSLNHGIYKGSSIRDIVNRMIQAHPMLLPKDKNTTLLLHPTAAISAFLAAAFILNVDGVKAFSIEQVIFDSLAGNTQHYSYINTANYTSPRDLGVRGDHSKSAAPELNISNYSVVVLGAALIAHELVQTTTTSEKIDESIVHSTFLNEKEETVSEEASVSKQINLEYDKKYENLRGEEESIDTASFVLRYENVSKVDQKLDSEDEKYGIGIKQASPFKDEHIELDTSIHATLQDFSQGSQDFKISQQLFKQASLKSEGLQNLIKEDFGINELPEGREGEFFTDLQNSYRALPVKTDYLGNDRGDDIEGIGVTLGITGEIKMVSFDVVEMFNPFESFGVSPQSVSGSSLFDRDIVTIRDENVEKLNETKVLEEQVSVSQVGPTVTRPILGHVLQEIGPSLSLTEATDVIFYEGGNVQISHFQLGVDLLWFFLPESEIIGAKNTLNEQGDLILDFGDVGKLTFLEVISDSPWEYTV